MKEVLLFLILVQLQVINHVLTQILHLKQNRNYLTQPKIKNSVDVIHFPLIVMSNRDLYEKVENADKFFLHLPVGGPPGRPWGPLGPEASRPLGTPWRPWKPHSAQEFPGAPYSPEGILGVPRGHKDQSVTVQKQPGP